MQEVNAVADVISNLSSGAAGALAAAIVVPVVLFLILRTVRPTAHEVEGKRVLEYGRPMKLLVTVFWIFWVGFVVAALFAPAKDRVMAVAVVMGFLLMILSLHLEFFAVRVTFDAKGITSRSPWRRKREIPWSVVERVWYSQAMQWYVIQTIGFGRVRLHIYLSGVESLLHELEKRSVPVARRPSASPIAASDRGR